jgi:CHAT domain-containing protein
MLGGLRGLAAALVAVSCSAGAQDARPLPKCHTAESMQLTREHRWAEALESTRRQLAQIESAPADAAAVAAAVCLRAYTGAYLMRLERRVEALAVFQALLPEARAKLGADHGEVLNAELLAAYAHGSAGQYQQEIQLLQSLRPRVARRYGARSAEMRNVLQELSSAHSWTFNFEASFPLDREVLAINEALMKEGKCHTVADCRQAVARSQQHLADTLRRVERAAEALPLAEAGVAGQTEILGPTHPNTLDARLVLASVHQALGHYSKALEIEKDVLALAQKHHGPENSITRKARGNVAVTLTAMGQGKEARELEYVQLSQVRARRGPNHPETLLSLANLSDRLLRNGDVDAALPLLEEALGAMLATRSGLAFDDRLTFAWQSRWKRIVDDYVDALLRKKRTADAFLVSEHFKARLLADRLSLDPSERALSEEERTRLRRLKRSLASVEQSAALKRALRQPAGAEESARADLLKRISDFRPAAGAQAALPTAKQAPDWYMSLHRAEQASARISYIMLRGVVHAFVDRGGQVQVYNLGDGDAIRDTIEAYRVAMRVPPGAKPAAIWKRGIGGGYTASKPHAEAAQVTDLDEVLGFLSHALIRPLAAELRGKSRLLISPYQALAYAPFDALHLDGVRLGDRVEVTMVPSLALHAQLARRAAEYRTLQRRPFLGFGGAPYQRVQLLAPNIVQFTERDFKVQPMDVAVIAETVRKDPSRLGLAYLSLAFGFPDLPATHDEVRTIARRMGGESFYLAEERASEENLNRLADSGDLAKYRIVHFSAHGFLNEGEPALSAIVLSQLNRAPGTDGYVTVAEIAGFELRADLVVISTCDSGVGKLQQGEGVLGMSYALFQAGALSSVVTLWPVTDRGSALLMMRFYEELSGEGVSVARALSLAKRWALANGVAARTVDAFVVFGG